MQLNFSLLFFFLSLNVFAAVNTLSFSTEKCLSCHQEQVNSHSYYQSSHKDLTCTACHLVDKNHTPSTPPKSSRADQCITSFQGVDCSRCHEKAVTEHASSVHNSKRLPVACSTCHSDIHSIQTNKKDKVAIAKTCVECHSQQKNYFQSQHFSALEKNHQDAATCTDCHGLHAISKVDISAKDRIFHTATCLQCHADKEKMKKNEVSTVAAETYFNSFHGKNVRLGYPEKVAGCADCHTAHNVNKSDNILSSIHPTNLVKTCSQCHVNATAAFTQYIAHAEDDDKTKYPALYWAKLTMTGLLVGTFLFFWIHSLLWMIRTLIEKYKKEQNQPSTQPFTVSSNLEFKRGSFESYQTSQQKLYKRFTTGQIFLHVIVIISFLGLSLTGLPLKFSSTNWAKFLFHFIGGAERARLIHHISAIITFTYFGIIMIKSIRYLFFDKQNKGSFTQKLFGPDSLFPNKRDLKDVAGMFRWFFFIGPKPTFERWTYWEKFDFMAVFWGMFAIGSSGMLLWFPVFFGQFLPGWVFNLATIIHSDEALLATGFIFTVHFFNTHLRVEKFPMDLVIFSGQVTEQEMIEERGDQWKRYQAENRTHEFLVENPRSELWIFAFKVFGFLAVMIGLSLVVGMLVTLV